MHKFVMKQMYNGFKEVQQEVQWVNLFYNNMARPRSCLFYGQLAMKKLATKERLHRFGMMDNDKCNFRSQVETVHHLFFESAGLKQIWEHILEWMQIQHSPRG